SMPLVTRICSRAPAFSARWKRGKASVTTPGLLLPLLAAVTTRLSDLVLQPPPLHETATIAFGGACTVSSLILAPDAVSVPAIRTIGHGCISLNPTATTFTVSATVLDSPFASDTSRRTTCGPTVEKVAVFRGPPATRGPLPAVSQAKPVIGLDTSAELDTNETLWPTAGAAGTQANEATGGVGVAPTAIGGAVTVNVSGELEPVFPASSDCRASTVY